MNTRSSKAHGTAQHSAPNANGGGRGSISRSNEKLPGRRASIASLAAVAAVAVMPSRALAVELSAQQDEARLSVELSALQDEARFSIPAAEIDTTVTERVYLDIGELV